MIVNTSRTAPHHLSGNYPSPGQSPRASSDNLHYQGPSASFGGPGPRYLSPLAAAAATESQGLGGRSSQASYSEMSMLGPGLQRKSTWLRKEQNYKKKGHLLVSSTSFHARVLTHKKP